jgi:hypothetical protein
MQIRRALRTGVYLHTNVPLAARVTCTSCTQPKHAITLDVRTRALRTGDACVVSAGLHVARTA